MLKVILLVLFIVSCSTTKKKEPIKLVVETPDTLEVYNGKVKRVTFSTNLKSGKYLFNCNGNIEIPFHVHNEQGVFYWAESYFSGQKKYDCRFKDLASFKVQVKEFPYKSEKLNVDKKRVFLSKKDLKRVKKERVVTANVYKDQTDSFLFKKPFILPLNSYVTSHYGNRRVFNNKKRTQHLGNDFRSRTPEPIPVANRGRVVFAGDLFYTGNVVIVEHGLGIFTIYGHLSKIHVEKGDILKQGDSVGLSGATGRVSGPHLHWGVKINGHWVDGFSLVEETKNIN